MSSSLFDAHATSSSSTLLDSVSSVVSTFFPTAHADEGDDEGEGEGEGGEDGGDGAEEEAEEEEEEEEDDEPEDNMPQIYEQCENSRECAPAKHHFLECQERVEAGEGFKDENCVEEFAPRVFKGLK